MTAAIIAISLVALAIAMFLVDLMRSAANMSRRGDSGDSE